MEKNIYFHDVTVMSQWSHSVVTQQHHSDFTLWHHCDMYVLSYRWESHCDYHVSLTVWLSQCDFDNGSQLIWHEYSLLYHTRLTLWESHCETHVTVMWCSQCDSHSVSLVCYHSKYGMMSCVDPGGIWDILFLEGLLVWNSNLDFSPKNFTTSCL